MRIILDIKNLTIDKLKEPAIVEEVYASILAWDNGRELGQAINLLRKLNELFSTQPNFAIENPELHKKYQDYIILLEFVTLPNQIIDKIKQLFRENLVFSLEKEIDVKDKIDFLFVSSGSAVYCEKWAREIRLAMSENKEKLGNKSIKLSGGEKEFPPYVSNWLRDYSLFFSQDKPRSHLEEANYLSRSENARFLTKKDRDILTQIIKIDNFLRYPQLQLEVRPTVAEEPFVPLPTKILGTAELKQAQQMVKKFVKKVEESESAPKPKTKPPAPAPKKDTKLPESVIIKNYQGSVKEQEAVQKVEQEIAKAIGKDFRKLVEEFDLIINPLTTQKPDKIKLIASLRILAKLNKLEELLSNRKFVKRFVQYLEEKNKPELIEGFNINPGAPQYLKFFLQYVLEEKAGFDKNESARIGMQIVNILKKQARNGKYDQLVYYDLKSAKFSWK